MSLVAYFAIIALVTLGVAAVQRWPIGMAALTAVSFAASLSVIAAGADLAVPYELKASIVAVGAVLSTWAVDRIASRRDAAVPTD